MERLSDTAIEIVNELHRERLDYASEYLPLIDALNRLTAYEDTGYTPAEIADLAVEKATAETIVKQYEEWEKDGTIIRPPCTVGDLLYEIDLPEYGVIVCKAKWMILKNGVSVQVEVVDGHGLGSGYCFEPSDFGKTVFLTREAAEAKLKTLQNT